MSWTTALMTLLMAAILAVLSAGTASASTPFSDGDFETAAPGVSPSPWSVGGDGVNWLTGWNTPNGSDHAVDLNKDDSTSQGSVSQAFNVVAGQAYAVTFWLSANP